MPFLLVVDDDPVIRENICDLFAGEYFCQGVGSAEEALAVMETEPFDVVVTDITMPGMSGVELLGLIKQRQPDTPVIVLSGNRDPDYKTGMLGLGAFGYHLKPYKLEEIEASIASAVEHRRRLLKARQRSIEEGGGADDERKLYALSIYVAKPNGEEIVHVPELVLAASEGEAKHMGIEQAHQRWPRAEGWVEYNIVATEARRDIILHASKLISKKEG